MTVNNKLQLYSGLTGVVVLWTGVLVAMAKAHLAFVDSRPLSYLGVDSKTAVIFSLSLLLSSGMFINFGYSVRKLFGVRNRFLLYFLVGQGGQIVAAVAPYGDNSRYRLVHTMAAFMLAFSLPLLIREFSVSQAKTQHAILYRNLVRFEQFTFVVGMGLFIFTKGIAPLGEALPALGFHLWIIVVTIIAMKEIRHGHRRAKPITGHS